MDEYKTIIRVGYFHYKVKKKTAQPTNIVLVNFLFIVDPNC